ncbi:MAG: hypothetical protein PWQ10_276 [Patescibacteria group bacterium]|nr:hypothetical protein [Patescibacteria group bacterium]
MREEPLMVSIRDLGVAAALVTCGFEVADMNRDINGRMYFIFQETVALDETVNGYYADTIVIKARKFFDNTKMLKGRIYSEQ